MRDHLVLFVNGRRLQISGPDAFMSLSDYLRRRLGLTGTKIVCSEGDCGSCTVLVGRPRDGGLHYQAVDSCIQFLLQLDGAHIVTVEGLCDSEDLTAVQREMVNCHGSQCGFCTPGFVVAMTGALENESVRDEDQWRAALTGNLCRCTGYSPILEAADRAALADDASLESIYPASRLLSEMSAVADQPIAISDATLDPPRTYFSPTSLPSALQYLDEHPQAVPIAGGTDLGVQINKHTIKPNEILDLNRVHEINDVDVTSDRIVCGARATWTDLESTCRERVPELFEIISIFGSPQIRNVGTIGGNIINASPIADSLPFLFVMEAELELQSVAGARSVNINDFYLGYKKLDRHPNELLTNVRIPLPSPTEKIQLLKVSRRRDLDISSFTAAIRVALDGDTIESARIAYGAVGPTVLRLPRTEQFLQGQTFTADTMAAAGDIAVEEITPISDVRGSSTYRTQLARNCLLRFYHHNPPLAVT